MPDARATVERVFREEWGATLATLIRHLGDFDRAEEALMDAFAVALETWTGPDRIPERPGAWIVTTARRRALDRLRHEAVRARKQGELEALAAIAGEERAEDGDEAEPIADDRLRLIFTCCHPALAMEARVALTLRALGGLSTAAIARAFLVPEPTMAQRLVRAKRKIRDAGIGYRVPPPAELSERVAGVLAVVYLIFNEGYFPSSGGQALRPELTAEAVRLGRLLAELLPEPEVLGLLALMLLQDSRRAARVDAAGRMVPLDEQDRSLWSRAEIDEGIALCRRALAMRRPGSFQVQAAIAAVHAEAERAADTDWDQLAALYGTLLRFQPTPVVELNRAVAVGRARGPEAGLALAERSGADGALDGYQPFHAARADFLRRLDRRAEAAEAYRRALELTDNDAARQFLERRLREVEPT